MDQSVSDRDCSCLLYTSPLTDEEIQAAYFRAEEAYGWFSLETLPCGEKTQTIDGWLYYPVEYPGMENLADLRAYLRGLFSEELVDALLASGGAHPLSLIHI